MSTHHNTLSLYIAVGLLSLTLGCGGEDSEDPVSAQDSDLVDAKAVSEGDIGVRVDAGERGSDGGVDSPDPSCPAHWVKEISGSILDEDGAPIRQALAQMCIRLAPGGRLECLQPSRTGEDGGFLIQVPEGRECMESGSLRVIKPSSGYATTYCAMDLSQPRLQMEAPIILFGVEPATDRPPEGDPSEARPVILPGGMEIQITPGEMFVASSAGYEQLAGSSLSAQHAGICQQIDRPELDGIYLISPEADVTRGGGFPFKLPLIAPEGTQGALYVLGGLDCHIDEEEVPEAAWRPFGTGTVQGNQLIADDANGLPCFGWLGYKLNLE